MLTLWRLSDQKKNKFQAYKKLRLNIISITNLNVVTQIIFKIK